MKQVRIDVIKLDFNNEYHADVGVYNNVRRIVGHDLKAILQEAACVAYEISKDNDE